MMAKHDIYSLWFGLVLILVVALLVEFLLEANFSDPVYWIRIFFVSAVLFLSVIVFMQRSESGKKHYRKYKKLERVYASNLNRKNKQIKELKEKNAFLVKTALKQAERAKTISDQARMLIEGKKKKK